MVTYFGKLCHSKRGGVTTPKPNLPGPAHMMGEISNLAYMHTLPSTPRPVQVAGTYLNVTARALLTHHNTTGTAATGKAD